MFIVHLCTTDTGGAYEACSRISDALNLQADVESVILVRSKLRDNSIALSYYDTLYESEKDSSPLLRLKINIKKLESKIMNFGNLLLSDKEVRSDYFGTDITKHPLIQKADVICLHWVNSFVCDKAVSELVQLGKPIYWVLHDMYPMTGGCHHAAECSQYQNECNNCPQILNKNFSVTKKWQQRKKKYYSKDITIIGPSEWIYGCARKSSLFRDNRVVTINNPIDTNFYRPLDISNCSDGDKCVLLFSATGMDRPEKGFSYLIEALRGLDNTKYELLLMGASGKNQFDFAKELGIKTTYTGFISDKTEIVKTYNRADILIAPSLQENYSNTVLEAMACGLPIVAFDAGGMSELIDHRKNGYVAHVRDVNDLKSGIEWTRDNRSVAGEASRDKVVANTYEVIGKRYKELFENDMICTTNICEHNR